MHLVWPAIYTWNSSELDDIHIDGNWIDTGCTASNYMAFVKDTLCIHHLFACPAVLIMSSGIPNMHIKIVKGKFALEMANLPF